MPGPHLGQVLSLADAEKIVAAITAKYHSDGFVLSHATVQPQDLAFGIQRVDVVEGYIERVVFEGPVERRKTLLEDLAAKLKSARPLTQQVLERYVMLMSDLPGLSAQPSLRSLDDTSGAHELVLRLRQDDFEGFASIDNRSTRTVGRLWRRSRVSSIRCSGSMNARRSTSTPCPTTIANYCFWRDSRSTR